MWGVGPLATITVGRFRCSREATERQFCEIGRQRRGFLKILADLCVTQISKSLHLLIQLD